MNIGLIAHDSKKKLMQNFCIAYRGILCKNELYATGTTGRLIEEVTNLNVHKYLAGHLGGVQQLGAQIEHNEIDLVIFLRDPLTPKSHEPDVNTVVRICDTHNIPLATNLATAELLIKSLDRGDLEWREMYESMDLSVPSDCSFHASADAVRRQLPSNSPMTCMQPQRISGCPRMAPQRQSLISRVISAFRKMWRSGRVPRIPRWQRAQARLILRQIP